MYKLLFTGITVYIQIKSNKIFISTNSLKLIYNKWSWPTCIQCNNDSECCNLYMHASLYIQ